MMISKVLLMLILYSSYFVDGEMPDTSIFIKDGLVLSYWLKIDHIEKLNKHLKDKGFNEHSENSEEEKNHSYFKYLDKNQKEIVFIRIQDNKAISISHYHFEKGSKFPDAVRSKLLASDYFKKGSDENEFLFSFPIKDKSAASENDGYQYQSKILFNDVVIIFVVPSIASENIDWVNKIQKLKL